MSSLGKRRGVDEVDIERAVGDRVVVAGTFGQQPLGVLVPDELDGFLLFEKYANVGHGKSLVWIDGAGEVQFAYTLKELFGGKHPEGTKATVSSLWWNRGYWIDERNGAVVLVTNQGELRQVAIADGSISVPGDGRLFDGAMFGAPEGRALAMELLAEGPIERCRKAMSLVFATFLDQQQPLSLRLRAGWILHRAGAPEGVGDLFATAARDAEDVAARRFAIGRLPAIVGDDAMPVLRELMRGKASLVWGDAYRAFASIGEAAVPTLVEMLAEEGESNDYRGGAAHALGEIGSLKAVSALREAEANGGEYVGSSARAALTRTLWRAVDRAFERAEAAGAEHEVDGGIAIALREQLAGFEPDWLANQTYQRVARRADDRYRRFVLQVRDRVKDK